MGKLHSGVCFDCLNSPARGRKWAEQAHKCRNDKDYAKKVYDSINTESGKKMFVAMFGSPSTPVEVQQEDNVVEFDKKVVFVKFR
jgi:hypothetical protein